eukprot:scaffold12017_cov120-Isochrysis_galbana.AAC.12
MSTCPHASSATTALTSRKQRSTQHAHNSHTAQHPHTQRTARPRYHAIDRAPGLQLQRYNTTSLTT